MAKKDGQSNGVIHF